MASVYKRGKRWYGRYQVRGQEVRRVLRAATRAAAQREVDAAANKTREAPLVEGFFYRTAVGRFNEEHMPTLKPQSQKRYRVSIKALEPHFGTLALAEIDRRCLANFVSARQAVGVTGAGIRRDLACLSSILSCAVNWGWVPHNPVKDFSKRSIRESTPRERYLSDAEIQKVKDACAPDLLDIVTFALEGGMRLGEILSLRAERIDRDRQEAYLINTKNGTSRMVPLSPAAFAIIGTKPAQGFVFAAPSGRRRREDNISTRFRRACKRAGVPNATFHDLRHTFASRALQGRHEWQSGPFDVPRLQRWLGHSTIGQTMRYAHLASDDLRALVNPNRHKNPAQAKELDVAEKAEICDDSVS